MKRANLGVNDSASTLPAARVEISTANCLCCYPCSRAGVGVAENPGALYGAMHSYLASSAVDGVKVDCQAGVGLVGSALGGGPAAAREFQAALEESIATHFPGNHAINCMCHSSENFYRCVV
jgi:raffinose synthase